MSERGYKKGFRKFLRKVKLQFRYSLNEAKLDLIDSAKDIAVKKLRGELLTGVRKDVIKSQLKLGQNVLVNFHKGTLWDPIYNQVVMKVRLLNELLNTMSPNMKALSENMYAGSRRKLLPLKHVDRCKDTTALQSWVIEQQKSSHGHVAPRYSPSVQNNSLISDVTPPLSPASQHTVDDNDVHIVPYIESEQLSSVTKNSDSTSKANRYKIGIKPKLVNHASEKKRKVLFDRTNLGSEAGAILHKAILEPVKHIDLPQNPFSINRSYEEDLLPSRGSEHP